MLNRVRDLRHGHLNETRFGHRMRGEGIFAQQIAGMFQLACKSAGVNTSPLELSTHHFRNPQGRQLTLFD